MHIMLLFLFLKTKNPENVTKLSFYVTNEVDFDIWVTELRGLLTKNCKAMKTLKIITGLLIVLGFTFNNVFAQKHTYTYSEDWTDQWIFADCLPEALVGTLSIETLVIGDSHVQWKGSGIFYSEFTNEPYEVVMVEPGWFTISDKKGTDWTFIIHYKIYKDGRLIANVQSMAKVRTDKNGRLIVFNYWSKSHCV